MKKLFKIVLLIGLLNTRYSLVNAQNLVPNPSFEDTVQCPSTFSEIAKAKFWFSFGNTPDYFNQCAQSNVSVPNNFNGSQDAKSGDAYAGLYSYEPSGTFREYVAIRLDSPLMIGNRYFISGYFSRSDIMICANNNIGFRFYTDSLFSSTNPAVIDNIAQYNNSSILNDSINWVFVNGSFIADSNYNYLAIGNFFSNSNTSTVGDCSTYAAYYYLDNICVSTDSLICADLLSANHITVANLITLSPNPTDLLLNIFGLSNYSTLHVFNSIGQLIASVETFVSNYSLNTSNYPNGIYFLKVNSNEAIKFSVIH